MNLSGPAVVSAFKTFAAQYPRNEEYECGLVVMHDELELEGGEFETKKGDRSAKGHNGMKSVQQCLAPSGLMGRLGGRMGSRFVKLGVGIGRPVSRERDDVSGYVLGQLSGGERSKIEGCVQGVVELLEKEVERMGRIGGEEAS